MVFAVFVRVRASPFVFSCFLERVGSEPVLKGQTDVVPPLTSVSHHAIGGLLRPWWAHDGRTGRAHEAYCPLPLSSRLPAHVLCTSRFTDAVCCRMMGSTRNATFYTRGAYG
eukprot:1445121-Pyramimonas_sp.AAC.1